MSPPPFRVVMCIVGLVGFGATDAHFVRWVLALDGWDKAALGFAALFVMAIVVMLDEPDR